MKAIHSVIVISTGNDLCWFGGFVFSYSGVVTSAWLLFIPVLRLYDLNQYTFQLSEMHGSKKLLGSEAVSFCPSICKDL